MTVEHLDKIAWPVEVDDARQALAAHDAREGGE